MIRQLFCRTMESSSRINNIIQNLNRLAEEKQSECDAEFNKHIIWLRQVFADKIPDLKQENLSKQSSNALKPKYNTVKPDKNSRKSLEKVKSTTKEAEDKENQSNNTDVGSEKPRKRKSEENGLRNRSNSSASRGTDKNLQNSEGVSTVSQVSPSKNAAKEVSPNAPSPNTAVNGIKRECHRDSPLKRKSMTLEEHTAECMKLTVKVIRAELKRLKIPVGGKKAIIAKKLGEARLKAAMENPCTSVNSAELPPLDINMNIDQKLIEKDSNPIEKEASKPSEEAQISPEPQSEKKENDGDLRQGAIEAIAEDEKNNQVEAETKPEKILESEDISDGEVEIEKGNTDKDDTKTNDSELEKPSEVNDKVEQEQTKEANTKEGEEQSHIPTGEIDSIPNDKESEPEDSSKQEKEQSIPNDVEQDENANHEESEEESSKHIPEENKTALAEKEVPNTEEVDAEMETKEDKARKPSLKEEKETEKDDVADSIITPANSENKTSLSSVEPSISVDENVAVVQHTDTKKASDTKGKANAAKIAEKLLHAKRKQQEKIEVINAMQAAAKRKLDLEAEQQFLQLEEQKEKMEKLAQRAEQEKKELDLELKEQKEKMEKVPLEAFPKKPESKKDQKKQDRDPDINSNGSRPLTSSNTLSESKSLVTEKGTGGLMSNSETKNSVTRANELEDRMRRNNSQSSKDAKSINDSKLNAKVPDQSSQSVVKTDSKADKKPANLVRSFPKPPPKPKEPEAKIIEQPPLQNNGAAGNIARGISSFTTSLFKQKKTEAPEKATSKPVYALKKAQEALKKQKEREAARAEERERKRKLIERNKEIKKQQELERKRKDLEELEKKKNKGVKPYLPPRPGPTKPKPSKDKDPKPKPKDWDPDNNYVISDKESSDDEDSYSDDSDDSRRKKKAIPGWAKGPDFREALRNQYEGPNRIDPDALFGQIPFCDLEAIFEPKCPKKKNRYRARGSSAHWHHDGLTIKEAKQYRIDVGLDKQ